MQENKAAVYWHRLKTEEHNTLLQLDKYHQLQLTKVTNSHNVNTINNSKKRNYGHNMLKQ